MLMRRATTRLAPHASTSIPLAFDPQVIAEHHATVTVAAEYHGRELIWTFPVRGIVEAPLQLRAALGGVETPRRASRKARNRVDSSF